MSEEIIYKVPEGVRPETNTRKKKTPHAVSADGQLGHQCDHGCNGGCGCGGC